MSTDSMIPAPTAKNEDPVVSQSLPEPPPNPLSQTNSPYNYEKYESLIAGTGSSPKKEEPMTEYHTARSSPTVLKSDQQSPTTIQPIVEPNSELTGQEQQPLNSKVTVCCMDVQTGLSFLVVLDMITALACLILFTILWIERTGYTGKLHLNLTGLFASCFMILFLFPLLCIVLTGTKVGCFGWTFHFLSWLVFLANFIVYTFLLFSFGVGGPVHYGIYGVLCLVFLQRIYEIIAIRRFNNELNRRIRPEEFQGKYEVPGGMTNFYPPPSYGAQYVPVGGYPFSGFGHPVYGGIGYGGYGGTYYGGSYPYYGPGAGLGLGLGVGLGVGLGYGGLYDPYPYYYDGGWY